ncbi:hypothetical protein FJ930_18330 [Mesorhizobium sp. B2-4-15]|uniref:hypothetical protein n=1 Tax=Mesorhizobium sp. B2-4-15 TaxID=2589934 RepID=UPI0011514F11|nr:hypothetical protein [Mesorhizobium sp. B2-4-15]TPK70283.1 hypothetical protein FJ930_18330 [Mesorhizobium sp. B2-4-15]
MHGNLGPIRRARIIRRDDTWTFAETEILRRHWPDIALLRKVLPHRTAGAMRFMAKKCGLVPDKIQNVWTGAQDKKLRQMAAAGDTRKQIAAELGLTVAQIDNRLLYRKINIAKRPPKESGNPLFDEVRRRAFNLNMTGADLDRSLGNQRIFRSHGKGQRVSTDAIHRAVKALGGVLKIEWIDE